MPKTYEVKDIVARLQQKGFDIVQRDTSTKMKPTLRKAFKEAAEDFGGNPALSRSGSSIILVREVFNPHGQDLVDTVTVKRKGTIGSRTLQGIQSQARVRNLLS